MADASLDIAINTLVNTYGADQVNDSLKKLKQNTEGATEAAGHHNKSANEMRLLFHSLNQLVPGLGHALHAAFHPGNVGLGLLVVGLVEVVRLYREHKKALDEIATAQAEIKVAVWEHHEQ